jgi:hypothetical protein
MNMMLSVLREVRFTTIKFLSSNSYENTFLQA